MKEYLLQTYLDVLFILQELLIYIAHEGMFTADLFRHPIYFTGTFSLHSTWRNVYCTYLDVLFILQELLVYIAHEGMFTADLFRRPGNPGDTRRIVKRLSEGKPVIFQNYNLYTLASVVKVTVNHNRYNYSFTFHIMKLIHNTYYLETQIKFDFLWSHFYRSRVMALYKLKNCWIFCFCSIT